MTSAPFPASCRRKLPPPIWLVVLAFLLFAGMYCVVHRSDYRVGWQDDLPVYAGAVQNFRQGIDPYTQAYRGLLFVYPPVVLYAGKGLVAVFGESVWQFGFLVHVVCLLLTPLILARYYLRASWLTPAMALLVFFAESRFTGVMAIYSDNVAPSLYFAALLAGVPGIRRNRWGWFYLVVFLAGLIKLTFIILLLLPLLAGARQRLRSGTCAACVAAAYALQSRLVPALYSGYKNALIEQVQVRALYGYGVFGVAASFVERLHRHVGIGVYAVYGVFATTVMVCLLWLRRIHADRFEGGVWLAVLLMAIILLNPRMLAYDAYLALFAAFFVLATFLAIDRWQLIALLCVMFLPSLVVPHLLRTRAMYGSYELLLVLIALGLGVAMLFKYAKIVNRDNKGTLTEDPVMT